MRKMACNFGWDRGPTLVTAGIWKTIQLESWSKARSAGVRPEVTLEGADGRVRAHVDVEGGAGLHLRASVAGIVTELPVGAVLDLVVPSPALWWPHGLGSQPLYELVVDLLDEAGAVTDSWRRKIGF